MCVFTSSPKHKGLNGVWEGHLSERVPTHPSFHSSVNPSSVYVLPAPLFSTNVQNLLLLSAQYKMCYKKKKNSVLIVLHWLNVTTKLFLIFSGYFLHIYFAVVSNKYKFRKNKQKNPFWKWKDCSWSNFAFQLFSFCMLPMCFRQPVLFIISLSYDYHHD